MHPVSLLGAESHLGVSSMWVGSYVLSLGWRLRYLFFTVGHDDRLGPGPVPLLCWDPGSNRPSVLISSLLSPLPGC